MVTNRRAHESPGVAPSVSAGVVAFKLGLERSLSPAVSRFVDPSDCFAGQAGSESYHNFLMDPSGLFYAAFSTLGFRLTFSLLQTPTAVRS